MNLSRFCRVAAIAVLSVLSVRSATLTQVPMQGGMAMPMVSYGADEGRFRVMMPPEIPELTPLMVSHPGDSFGAADPWFDALDPGRRGLSFSRRYGFVMDVGTDPLPDGTSMWIRKLSGPAGLEVYRYGGMAPTALEPIFGTAGSPMARAWNGMMFHPVFAAPAGTTGYEAAFEVYLVESANGAEVAGSGSGALTFRFTNARCRGKGRLRRNWVPGSTPGPSCWRGFTTARRIVAPASSVMASMSISSWGRRMITWGNLPPGGVWHRYRARPRP